MIKRKSKEEKKYSKPLITKLFKKIYDDIVNTDKKAITSYISYLKIKAYKTGKGSIRFKITLNGNIIKGISFGNALFNIINELENKEVVCAK